MPKSAYCEFEEKEYETKMNFELAYSEHMIYAPGQVKEHILGFDAALLSHHPDLWQLFPYSGLHPGLSLYDMGPNGITLSSEYWRSLDQSVNHFPAMQFNAFLQYKRPRCMIHGGAERQYWNQPYYRYNIESTQQAALEKLDAIAGHDALVTYASPCFYSYEALWDFAGARTLAGNSNFARPSNVSGHSKYTYAAPGAAGMGHSDRRELNGEPFHERVKKLREDHSKEGRRAAANRGFIKRTAEQLAAAASDSPLKPLYISLSKRLTDEEQEADLASEVVVALRRVLLFCTLANVSWHIAV